MQFAGRRASWKVANGAKNLVPQALQFQKLDVCRQLPGEQA
jgi:hypothetical protein